MHQVITLSYIVGTLNFYHFKPFYRFQFAQMQQRRSFATFFTFLPWGFPHSVQWPLFSIVILWEGNWSKCNGGALGKLVPAGKFVCHSHKHCHTGPPDQGHNFTAMDHDSWKPRKCFEKLNSLPKEAGPLSNAVHLMQPIMFVPKGG